MEIRNCPISILEKLLSEVVKKEGDKVHYIVELNQEYRDKVNEIVGRNFNTNKEPTLYPAIPKDLKEAWLNITKGEIGKRISHVGWMEYDQHGLDFYKRKYSSERIVIIHLEEGKEIICEEETIDRLIEIMLRE